MVSLGFNTVPAGAPVIRATISTSVILASQPVQAPLLPLPLPQGTGSSEMLVLPEVTITAMDPAIADGPGRKEATGTIQVLPADADLDLIFLDIYHYTSTNLLSQHIFSSQLNNI